MARDVDRVMDYVHHMLDVPPVHRQVMLNRLDPPPTQEELDRAREQVYPTKAVD